MFKKDLRIAISLSGGGVIILSVTEYRRNLLFS